MYPASVDSSMNGVPGSSTSATVPQITIYCGASFGAGNYGMLLDHPGVAEADFSSVRSIIYGASPMPRPTIDRALQLWGPRFLQYYGQTEAPVFITHLTKEDHVGSDAAKRLAACGRPSIDCEIRLVDEDGHEVAPGEAGEIALRAPFMLARLEPAIQAGLRRYATCHR